MGRSTYNLTDEQKGKLNDIVQDIIEELPIHLEEPRCLDIYDSHDGKFDNNNFTAIVWYIGDRLSSY